MSLKIKGDLSMTSASRIRAPREPSPCPTRRSSDLATNNVTTLAADHTGSISYTDADSLSVGSVTDTAMSMSVSTTGMDSDRFELKVTEKQPLSPLPVEDPVTLGAGDLARKDNGAVS